ncbi:MAG: TonB-dependent hemoglobin/transferrin/lactoferrin family receptor [Calothrix sp. C42_A2020_038]|nr:TonB-dependent hemoglobin/transferrin/lactoferrin family receptor [Calothrix sp. C42_A2020_038]
MKLRLLFFSATLFNLYLLSLSSTQALATRNREAIDKQQTKSIQTNFQIAKLSVEITGVKLEKNENGVEILLETPASDKLQTIPQEAEKLLIIDIPNAKLRLTSGDRVSFTKPTEGIAEIIVNQKDENTIRVTVVGETGKPQVELFDEQKGLIFQVNSIKNNQASQPPAAEKPIDESTASAKPEATPAVEAQPSSANTRNENSRNESDIEITVTGTRTERAVQDTPGTISVIRSEELETNFVQDIKDLARYEPGVSVRNRPTRSGNSSINIRGIEGNRVLIQVDGVRVPDIYFNTSRDLVDFDSLKRVEIIRGPGSSLYGSDAIGGVVSYITKDPLDYLDIFGKEGFVSGKVTYNSVDSSFAETFTVAAGDEQLSTSFVYTRRDGQESKNFGGRNPNPQTIGGNNFLGKVVLQPDSRNTFKLTGEFFEQQTDTDVKSAAVSLPGPPGSRRLSQNAEDYTRRGRGSIAYEYNNPDGGFVQKARSQFYYQDAETTENVQELRQIGNTLRRRVSQNRFLQNMIGGDIQLESNFQTGSLNHRLVYGSDILNTNTSRPRDNTEFNLTARTSTKNVGGELFPNKTFPDTDTLRIGLYIQDEISLADNKITIIPGIRYDYYQLKPYNNDADFARINTENYRVEGISASAISPKLGIIAKLTPEVSLYGQYVRGFRSPPYDDAAIAFTNFASFYTVLPNADLKPETSDSYELGLRYNSSYLNAGVTGFYNRYKNFIQTVFVDETVIGGRTFQRFQSQNTEGAEIYGVEAKVEYRFSGKPEGLNLFSSLAYAEGTDLRTNQPLDSVNPLKAIIGIGYRSPENRWGTQLFTTLVGRKDQVTSATQFKPSGYTSVDLTGYYNFNPNTTLNIGVFNLFNQKYWEWSDVRGLTTTSPDLELYTQPGLNVAASLTVRF